MLGLNHELDLTPEHSLVIPWLLEAAIQATNTSLSHDAGMLTLAAQLLSKSLDNLPSSNKRLDEYLDECETCKGVGSVDERLGSYCDSNLTAECPDCNGWGYFNR
jgi:hypothetical protein